MRIFITGAGGFIAGSLLKQAPPDCEICAQTRGLPLWAREGLRWWRADPCDPSEMTAVLTEARPQAILHTAALANIDYCEQNRDEARTVNVEVTRTVAEYAANSGAKLVFLSTDNVFDGERGLYQEDDPPSPIHVYGETKSEAEALVTALPNGVVARVAVVTGLPALGRGNSFLAWMLRNLEAGEEVGVPANEIRTSIDAITVARALLELAGNDFSGIIHLAGNDRLNRFEMVQRIALRLGYDPALIVSNDPTVLPGRAPRPMDISLDNQLARRVLRTPMLGLEAALALITENRGDVSPRE
jgi:dTDP-4-dehydrorhamnose reductase